MTRIRSRVWILLASAALLVSCILNQSVLYYSIYTIKWSVIYSFYLLALVLISMLVSGIPHYLILWLLGRFVDIKIIQGKLEARIRNAFTTAIVASVVIVVVTSGSKDVSFKSNGNFESPLEYIRMKLNSDNYWRNQIAIIDERIESEKQRPHYYFESSILYRDNLEREIDHSVIVVDTEVGNYRDSLGSLYNQLWMELARIHDSLDSLKQVEIANGKILGLEKLRSIAMKHINQN